MADFSEIRREYEEGSYLPACDWGHCSRPTAGYALGDPDHPLVYDGDGWLAICARCAAGDNPAPDPVPVVRFVSFEELEAGVTA